MKILICDSEQHGFKPFLRAFQTELKCETEFLEIGDMTAMFSIKDLHCPGHQSDDITDYYASLIKYRIIEIKPDIILFEISRFVMGGQAGWGWGFYKMQDISRHSNQKQMPVLSFGRFLTQAN